MMYLGRPAESVRRGVFAQLKGESLLGGRGASCPLFINQLVGALGPGVVACVVPSPLATSMLD